jgi:hypothetical protein
MTARFSFKYGNMTELLRKHLEWETRRRQDHGFDGCIANAYDGIIRELNNEDGRRRERAMYQLARLAQLNPYLVLALVRKSLDGELSVDLKERLSQFAGELLKRTGPIVVSPALLELLNQIIKRAADGLPEVEARLRALLGPIIVEF